MFRNILQKENSNDILLSFGLMIGELAVKYNLNRTEILELLEFTIDHNKTMLGIQSQTEQGMTREDIVVQAKNEIKRIIKSN